MATNIEINYYNGTDYVPMYPSTSATQVSYSNTSTSSVITGTNTQTAIDQLFQHVSNGKSQIASAITDKGVSTSSTASFSTMKTNISKIPTGVDTSDATATASRILSGYTAYGSSGTKITGSMTDRGAVSKSLSAGGSYTIPSGYHNGSGKITASSLSSQTSGTATASDILSGKTAWVSGSKLTGTHVCTVPSGYKQVYTGNISATTNTESVGGTNCSTYTYTINCGFKPTKYVIFCTSMTEIGTVLIITESGYYTGSTTTWSLNPFDTYGVGTSTPTSSTIGGGGGRYFKLTVNTTGIVVKCYGRISPSSTKYVWREPIYCMCVL